MRFSDDDEVNKMVEALVRSMEANPYASSPDIGCMTVADIKTFARRDFGAERARSIRITLH